MFVTVNKEATIKTLTALYWLPCICNSVKFQENKICIFIDSNSEVNTITLAFVVKLGLTILKTSIGVQKIDGLVLETYSMALAYFLLQNSLERVRFFEKTFLLVDINIEMILRIPFVSFDNADIKFGE